MDELTELKELMAIHETLEREIKRRGIKKQWLAKQIGVPRTHINARAAIQAHVKYLQRVTRKALEYLK